MTMGEIEWIYALIFQKKIDQFLIFLCLIRICIANGITSRMSWHDRSSPDLQLTEENGF